MSEVSLHASNSTGLVAPLPVISAQITQLTRFQSWLAGESPIHVVPSSLKSGTSAHLDTSQTRQTGPDSALGVQVQVLKTVQRVASLVESEPSLESGPLRSQVDLRSKVDISARKRTRRPKMDLGAAWRTRSIANPRADGTGLFPPVQTHEINTTAQFSKTCVVICVHNLGKKSQHVG